MKICIIGNSHTAALKHGLNLIGAELPEHKITFFAARGKKAKGLQVTTDGRKRKTLAPANPKGELAHAFIYTSGGKREIRFSDYDACLIHGFLKFPRYDRRISAAAKSAVLNHCVTGSQAQTLAGKVRECSDIPLWVSHAPLLRLRPGEFTGSADRYATYGEVLHDIEQAFGRDDVSFLSQPSETIESEIATRERYSSGSVRLDIGDKRSNTEHGVKEYLHMNGEFGARLLRKLFRELAG